jgi:multidrug efflux pump subunit AcrA (membrane-fusion protein)
MHDLSHVLTAPRRLGVPRSRRSLIILGATVLALLIVVRLGLVLARAGTASSSAQVAAPVQEIQVPPPLLSAHGVVQPVARANVASLGGGSVIELLVDVGQSVEKGQVVVRVAGASATELVVAPWSGTVNAVMIHAGDSVAPGSTLVSIGDPSRYQVETTDVDEYLVSRLRPMQTATVTLDALPDRTLRGTVASISPQVQTVQGAAPHYPTIINLAGAAPDLRPGMTVHIVFDT